jgi:hypothetical protein
MQHGFEELSITQFARCPSLGMFGHIQHGLKLLPDGFADDFAHGMLEHPKLQSLLRTFVHFIIREHGLVSAKRSFRISRDRSVPTIPPRNWLWRSSLCFGSGELRHSSAPTTPPNGLESPFSVRKRARRPDITFGNQPRRRRRLRRPGRGRTRSFSRCLPRKAPAVPTRAGSSHG